MDKDNEEFERQFDKPLSIGEHIEELRKRLFRCVILFVIAVAVCLYFQDTLMHVVTRPHIWAMRGLAQDMAAKRKKELLEKKPFEKIRNVLETCRARTQSTDVVEAAMGWLPADNSAEVKAALSRFFEAEKKAVEYLNLETLLEMVDARKEVEIGLLTIRETGKIDNMTSFELSEAKILDWISVSNSADGALQEYLRVLDDERENERRSQSFTRLKVLKYQESFVTYLKLSIMCALFAVSPFMLMQIWGFISVGLYHQERRVAYFFGPFSMVLFACGALFGYFVLIRLGLRFLASYGDPDLIENSITLGFYLSLFMLLTLVVGLVFELPLFMYALSMLGIISPEDFAKGRRYFVVLAFVIAAFLTPPDVITQILLGIPMLFLYEFGIILARIGRAKSNDSAPEDNS